MASRKPGSSSNSPIAEAKAAAETLLKVVCDFPFALPAHRSAWLAAVLTMLARHAIDGNVPAVLVDANARGSGKGLLVDCISMIATGHPIARSPQPKEDEEMRKLKEQEDDDESVLAHERLGELHLF